MPVAYTFANAINTIPLAQLDSNFASPITLGNTSIQLGNSVSTLNNMTFANVIVTSGNATFTNINATTANLTNVTITSGNVKATTANVNTANIGNLIVTGSTVLVSPLSASSGGTGLVDPGSNGNVLTSTGSGWVSSSPSAGTGVTAISFGSTGLTPSTPSSGNLTVAGTLVPGNGGTGLSSPGLTGNILTSNGTAWVSSSFGSGISGITLISTKTASNSASLSWTALAGYSKYLLIFQNLTMSGSGNFQIQFGTGAGPTYITSSYEYGYVVATGTGVTGDAFAANFIQINNNNLASSASGGQLSGFAFVSGMLSGSYTSISSQIFYGNSGTQNQETSGGWQTSSTTAKTAIKIIAEDGTFNIVSGTASLYGIAA